MGGQFQASASLPPERMPVRIEQEVVWVPGSVRTFWFKKPLAPAGILILDPVTPKTHSKVEAKFSP